MSSSTDDAKTRAALETVRALDADRCVFFGRAITVAARAARAELDASNAAHIEASARWLLAGDASEPPVAQPSALARIGFAVAFDPETRAQAAPLASAAVLVELLGAHVVIAAGKERPPDAIESAHVVLTDGDTLVVDVGNGRAVLCPGDIENGGAILVVEGPQDAKVRVLGADGAQLDTHALTLGGTKMTVQGGAR